MVLSAFANLLPRAANSALEAACRVVPAVALVGARQVGKTTLVRLVPALANRPYLTLDDFEVRTIAAADPEAVVSQAPELVLDEVQRCPDVLIAVKRAIDADPLRRPGRFVLTGSANLLVLERVAETLAGRCAFVSLWPFTLAERRGVGRVGCWSDLLTRHFREWRELLMERESWPADWHQEARLGGLPYPALNLKDSTERAEWFRGYTQTYLERDVLNIRAVQDLADFRRLMRATCLRIGGLVNQSELGRDVGISQAQVHRFLSVMEATYLLLRVPAYGVNRTKRLIKAPKLYWADTALALYLSGEESPRGAHLENMVLCELVAWRDLQQVRPEIVYWRTAVGDEVDFVIETAGRLLPVEVKTARHARPEDARGLLAFLREYPDLCDGGLLLYCGSEIRALVKNVLAVPWWMVC